MMILCFFAGVLEGIEDTNDRSDIMDNYIEQERNYDYKYDDEY